YAIKITQKNYPDTVQLGDVNDIDFTKFINKRFILLERSLFMINIKFENIQGGWMDFSINNHTFCVSYLTHFDEEMEYLLDLPNDDIKVKRIYIDGEGVDLYLTAWRVYDDLFIVWEEWRDDVKTYIMRFKYDEFIEVYNKAFNAVKD